ncbi:MAG TPA: hypothetical protein VMV18_00630 [bacterium]|nr:hypothetical protein [bacterium]
MRLPGVAVLLVVLAAVLPRPARAEVFHDAEVPPPGTVTLGAEGQFEFDPGTTQRVWAHASVSLFNGGELAAKVGFLNRDYNYFGGEFRYGLLPNGDGYPALMAYAGGHWIDRLRDNLKDFGGVDGGVTVSETIWEQSFYVGYDMDGDFVPELSRVVLHHHFLAGVKIPVSEHLAFFVEGGYGLHTTPIETRDYVSGGAALSF